MDLEAQILQTAQEDQQKAQDQIEPDSEGQVIQVPLSVEPQEVRQTIFSAIKKECTEDPTGRGYSGKSYVDITALLNNPYSLSEPPRINAILTGIPYAPNAVDEAIVHQALNS